MVVYIVCDIGTWRSGDNTKLFQSSHTDKAVIVKNWQISINQNCVTQTQKKIYQP